MDAPDQLYVSASVGRDFGVSVENEREIALFYNLLSITSCARIIAKRDFDAPGDTVDPNYVIAMPESEEHRLEGVDRTHVNRLCLGKCVRFRRRMTRAESVRKETFEDLFVYLDDHGYELRGDVILFPSFLNLDGNRQRHRDPVRPGEIRLPRRWRERRAAGRSERARRRGGGCAAGAVRSW